MRSLLFTGNDWAQVIYQYRPRGGALVHSGTSVFAPSSFRRQTLLRQKSTDLGFHPLLDCVGARDWVVIVTNTVCSIKLLLLLVFGFQRPQNEAPEVCGGFLPIHKGLFITLSLFEVMILIHQIEFN